jgi:murein DD-endopeptidase MepM/ murein hydrolase activator NlpD
MLAVCMLLFSHTGQPVEAQTGPTYIVQPGDTLYGIALNFGITVEALQAANGGLDPAALALGRALIIPGYEGIAGTLATHTLEPGETVDSLALRLGLQRGTLVRLNRLINPNRAFVNQNIVVVQEPDAGPPIEFGQTYVVTPMGGLVSLAAAQGESPWALVKANRLTTPARLAPGSPVLVPGGQRPARGLVHPLLEVRLGPMPVAQGRTLAVVVASAKPVQLAGEFNDSPLTFSRDGDSALHQVALQGIHRLANPNLYPLAIRAETADGEVVHVWQQIPVRAADYGADPPLQVDPATLDPIVTEPELDLIRATVSPVTPQRHWLDLFRLPSVGLLRSVYGSLRSYNGGPYDSFHTGVDFSGGEDRAITAPAAGVVVFTGALEVRGNATIIDHGWGVYTGYWHQSAVQVETGEYVEPGQVIGFNGATGRVTGPHLHWELWVGGVQVDPLQWTKDAIP